jgi:NifU-like protein involved in Fe-S cluster formation
MSAVLYNRDVLRLASSLVPNDRLLQAAGIAEARSPICGSRIQAEAALNADGVVTAIALRASACALGQASAAILRIHAVGHSGDDIAALRAGIAGALNGTCDMPDMWSELQLLSPAKDYPSRHAAILLPYDALLAAISNASMKAAG